MRWGTELHDRFMLPHFVAQDFDDVLGRAAASRVSASSPSGSRRISSSAFPRIGAIARRGVHVELRQAIEPWHVLGEEPAAGGTARYVDSSVERLQVKVSGLTESRHVVTCNGRRVPLHPTGRPGEFVAGVRYRAWQPPSCLHPTIPVHAPLVFDIVDTWNRPLARRLHVSRRRIRADGASRPSRSTLRGREPAAGALLRHRPHAGRDATCRPRSAIPSSRSRSTCVVRRLARV